MALKRDLIALADRRFDLVVIGGGIVGAWIACDAAQRGLTVGLIDKADFGAATSAASSKLAHGGLRYLARGEIGAAREALRERAVLRRIAPDAVTPLRFLMPVSGAIERQAARALLAVYDRLGGTSEGFKHAETLSRAACRAAEPMLAEAFTAGAIAYDDGLMAWPERLTLRVLADAARAGACLANHAQALGLSQDADGHRVDARDAITGTGFTIKARAVVNATGPWADRLSGGESRPITRSKGIHVLLPRSDVRHAVVVKRGGEHVFAVPWQDHLLVGTTDTAFLDDPDHVSPMPADLDALLDKARRLIPGLAATQADVRHAYAGLRPLSGDISSTYRASRRAEIRDHAGEGRPGLFSAVGGKWTTARYLAERVVDRVGAHFGKALAPVSTATRPLPPLAVPKDCSLADRVAYAVNAEMAVRIDDVIERRWRPDPFVLPPQTRADIAAAFHDITGKPNGPAPRGQQEPKATAP